MRQILLGKTLTLTVLLFSTHLFGSEVLLVHEEKPYVVVSQESEVPLEVNDRVCVIRDKIDIACGNVAVSETNFAIVRIDLRHEEIKKYVKSTKEERKIELEFQRPTPVKGDRIRLEERDPKKLIRALTNDLTYANTFAGEIISKERQGEIDRAIKKLENSIPFKPISVLAAGMNYVFPNIQYQQAMSSRWGLGTMVMYMHHSVNDGVGSLFGPGFFFTYNRYSKGPFNGFWWQLSPGFFRMTVTNGTLSEPGLFQMAILGTIGWRHFWKNKLNFGFGGGAFYFPFAKSVGNTALDFSGIVPSISIDGGIVF